MKSFFKNIQTLLIVALVIIIILLRNCQGKVNPKPDPIVRVKTVTKWDTIREKVPTYIPKWNTIIERDTTYLPKNIDTVNILKDYFAYKHYVDTFQTDSITLIINDTITENKIASRDIALNILYPTITITRDSVINNREFYAGPKVYGTINSLQYVGVESIFRSKKRTAFSVGVGVNKDFNVQFGAGLYWKLNK